MFFLFLLIEYYGLNAVRSLIVRNFYFTPIMRLLMMNSCHDENKNEIVWQPTELNYNCFSLSLCIFNRMNNPSYRDATFYGNIFFLYFLWKYRKNKQSNCEVHEKSFEKSFTFGPYNNRQFSKLSDFRVIRVILHLK